MSILRPMPTILQAKVQAGGMSYWENGIESQSELLLRSTPFCSSSCPPCSWPWSSPNSSQPASIATIPAWLSVWEPMGRRMAFAPAHNCSLPFMSLQEDKSHSQQPHLPAPRIAPSIYDQWCAWNYISTSVVLMHLVYCLSTREGRRWKVHCHSQCLLHLPPPAAPSLCLWKGLTAVDHKTDLSAKMTGNLLCMAKLPRYEAHRTACARSSTNRYLL